MVSVPSLSTLDPPTGAEEVDLTAILDARNEGQALAKELSQVENARLYLQEPELVSDQQVI